MLFKGQRLYANSCSDPTDDRLFVRLICHGIADRGVSSGRMLRENFYLHIVFGGEAEFDKTRVGSGDVFLMRPGIPHLLEIISAAPFEQYWLEFGGSEASKLIEKVFGNKDILRATKLSESLGTSLHEAVYAKRDSSLGFIGLLLTILSRLSEPVEPEDEQSRYVFAAMEFLRAGFREKITASDAAKAVGISEKYLCRLFVRKAGTTPSGFLRELRLSQAKALLSSSLTIGEIAAAVGFEDRNYFSRYFKDFTGMSPSEFREKMLSTG